MKKSKNQSENSGIHAWLILWRTSKAVETRAHGSIQALGLGLSDFAVLEVLLHKGALPVNEIGAKVLLTSSSMTAAIDRLEAQGLVERKGDPSDRRARLVTLTKKGEKLIASAFKQHARDLEEIMALDLDEREVLITLLRKLGRKAAGLTVD